MLTDCGCSAVGSCSCHGPCEPWCTVDDIVEVRDPDGKCDKDGVLALIDRLNQATPGSGDELFNHFACMASSILFRLSAEQFPGICQSRIYWVDGGVQCCYWPLRGKGWPNYSYDSRIDAFTNGSACYDPCRDSWEFGDRLTLPYTPVCSVESIVIPDIYEGGAPLLVLDPRTGEPATDENGVPTGEQLLKPDGTAYLPGDTYPLTIGTDDVRIVDGCHLVRCDDGDNWDIPTPALCEEPPSLCITFSHGYAPPPEGVAAACELAGELMKQKVTGKCRLPERAKTVTRGGVSFALIDPMEFLSKGRTGLYFPDLFLATWNPHGLTEPPAVWFPSVKSQGRKRRTFGVRNL